MRKPEFIDERIAECIASKAADRDDSLTALSSVTFNLCSNIVGNVARMMAELLFLAQDHTRYEGHMDNPETHGESAVTRHALYKLATDEIRRRQDRAYEYTNKTFAQRFQEELTEAARRALASYFSTKADYYDDKRVVRCWLDFPDGSSLVYDFPLSCPDYAPFLVCGGVSHDVQE